MRRTRPTTTAVTVPTTAQTGNAGKVSTEEEHSALRCSAKEKKGNWAESTQCLPLAGTAPPSSSEPRAPSSYAMARDVSAEGRATQPRTSTRTHTPLGAPHSDAGVRVYRDLLSPEANGHGRAARPARPPRGRNSGCAGEWGAAPTPTTAALALLLTDTEEPTPLDLALQASGSGCVHGETGRPGWSTWDPRARAPRHGGTTTWQKRSLQTRPRTQPCSPAERGRRRPRPR